MTTKNNNQLGSRYEVDCNCPDKTNHDISCEPNNQPGEEWIKNIFDFHSVGCDYILEQGEADCSCDLPDVVEKLINKALSSQCSHYEKEIEKMRDMTSHLDAIFDEPEQKWLKTDREQMAFGKGYNRAKKDILALFKKDNK